jgi:hypothetical protein
MEERRWRRPGLVGPIMLIIIGLLFLLSNLGVMQVNWWQLWRLWPVLLILIGLDVLSRHSRVASAVVLVGTLALVGGVFYFLATQPADSRPLFAAGPNLVANPVHQELGGAKQVDVQMHMGLGDLKVGAAEDAAGLLAGNLDYPQGWGAPVVTYTLQGDRGTLRLERRDGEARWVGPFGSSQGESWSVLLSPRVPLTLRLDGGASSSVLDLSRLQVTDLRISGGAGRTEILFPPEATAMTVRVDGGVGEVVLRIPETVPARIRVEGGLGWVNAATRFQHQGNTYETASYAGATNRLEILVNGGLGSLRVE